MILKLIFSLIGGIFKLLKNIIKISLKNTIKFVKQFISIVLEFKNNMPSKNPKFRKRSEEIL